MDNMKEKLKNIFKEKKTIGLTVVLILLLIVSLMTYGKNKIYRSRSKREDGQIDHAGSCIARGYAADRGNRASGT